MFSAILLVMNKPLLNNEHSVLLLCARSVLNAPLKAQIHDLLNLPLDWDKILRMAQQQQIVPFLYHHLHWPEFAGAIPSRLFKTIEYTYYTNLKRNLRFEEELSRVAEAASAGGLTIIPLKGLALIQTLYPNPALRVMNDVDILIKKGELGGLKDILPGLGWRELPRKAPAQEVIEDRHAALFSKRLSTDTVLSLEIHTTLAYARPKKIMIPRLWERAYAKTIRGTAMHYLSSEDTLLSLALHLRSHTRRLTLKFIIDIAELLQARGAVLDWPYIKTVACANRIRDTVYFFVYLARELSGAAVAVDALKTLHPPPVKRKLMNCLCNRYNFFSLKKWRAALLRLLLFDRTVDFLTYLAKVSFWERFFLRRLLPHAPPMRPQRRH